MKDSDERDWKLLALLYRHGGDPDVLKNVVPEWGAERLEHFLKCRQLTSQRRVWQSTFPKTKPLKGPPPKYIYGILSQADQYRGASVKKIPRAMQLVSQWQAHIYNVQRVQGTSIRMRKKRRYAKGFCPPDHGPLLSKAMLIISQEEEHPKPSSSSEPDYSEIYRYLSQLLAGQEPTQLSQGSAAKVLEMMKKVQLLASQSLDLKKLRHHLGHSIGAYLQPWSSVKGADSSASTMPQEETSSTLPQGQSSSTLPQGESFSKLLQGECSSTSPQGESSSAERDECPLFMEVEDEVKTSMEDLADHDPRCEEVKERLAVQCWKKQEARSLRVSELPGLNPFLLPPHLLYKPMDSAVSDLLEH